MSSSRFPFAGRAEAAAFLIDPGYVGRGEAARRIAEVWVTGSRLLGYDDRWLLVLPTPISVRGERAPGLPVRERGGRLLLLDRGREVDVAPDELLPVDLLSLVDLDEVVVVHLEPLAGGLDAMAPVVEPTRDVAPLRQRAGIGAPDTALARSAARLISEQQAARRDTRAGAPSWSRSGARAGANPVPRPHRAGRSVLARLISRSPAGALVGRRHARYVERLTKNFEKRNWDDALRGAISLSDGSGPLSLRLPRRRTGSLGPSQALSGNAGSVPFGPTVHAHLRSTYLQAAQDLERDDQYLLAAFVHADLLSEPHAAVDLLERHNLYTEAAELAEARQLDVAYAVRLWWRAGERQRALRLAAARGAFASALVRLGTEDVEAARDLRRAWIDERRASGDQLGAVSAAWPDPTLRDAVIPDLEEAVHAGGSVAGTALAHWLQHSPTEAGLQLGRQLLAADPDPVLSTSRGPFIDALAHHPVGIPAGDRELTSMALTALVRGDTTIDGTYGDVVSQLRKRADPVLAADLPRFKAPVWTLNSPFEIDLNQRGSLRVHDAVALDANNVLVALGEAGVRLLTHDGRVRARWEVPTHRIVLADHGRRALLITDRSPRYAVHQLDLPIGRPQPLPPLDSMPLDTYDGSRAILVSPRGIEWVEPAGNRWRLTWHELSEPGQAVYQVARTPNSMTALFTDPGIHLWRWDLPSITLRSRGTIEHAERMSIVASGEVALMQQNSGVATLNWHAPHGHRLTTETTYPTGTARILVSGNAFAVVDENETDTSVAVHAARDAAVSAQLGLPAEASPLFRSWRGLIVTGHTEGRLVVLDTVTKQLIGKITLQA